MTTDYAPPVQDIQTSDLCQMLTEAKIEQDVMRLACTEAESMLHHYTIHIQQMGIIIHAAERELICRGKM